MKNKTWVRFVESFILLPTLTISGTSVAPISQGVISLVGAPSAISLEKQNIEVSDSSNSQADVLIQAKKAEAIDAYFAARNMPLKGTGLKMVLEAEKNGLDWRLLPAIAVRESTGGKFACKKADNNSFGWGSCKIGFESNEKAIETVARNLGGNNPKTARHYDDKTTKEILRSYNPPSIVPRYAEQVMAIMKAVGPEEVEVTLAINN